jgi:RNA polymerase sigma-70 factor (ECF subfamily)
MSAGDSAAIQEAIARYGGLVWSLARRLGLPDSETEDAVHEVFTELWRNGDRYDPKIASETAFVATIARRRLIDRRRKIGRSPPKQQINESAQAPESGPAHPDLGEEASRAAKAFETLSPEQQRVLRLSVYEGLSHELIARSTGLPLGTVKTHARRGLMKLRDMLSRGAETAPAPPTSEGGA